MAPPIDDLLRRIAALEREMDAELEAVRAKWRYRIEKGRVRFEHDVRDAHRLLRRSIPRYLRDSQILSILTAPAIYSLIVPIALLDLWVSIYQSVCFRVYRIARVKRSAYIVIDRQHLAYLNGIEKLNCMYCGYANGVLAYVREVAGRTEQYWCPIRHARRVHAPHTHYREFVDYGDAQGYHARLIPLREELADDPTARDH
jgi:hypothetical protein